MPRKIVYQYNEKVGKYGCRFIKEIDSRRNNSGTIRRAVFKCPFCGNNFEADIADVRHNHKRSCGCYKSTHPSPTTLDLTGQKVGSMTVLYNSGKKDGNGSYLWVCKCSLCNQEVLKSASSLVHKTYISCGCQKELNISRKRRIDLTGKRFGKLVVLHLEEERTSRDKNRNGHIFWVCKCDCGSIITVCSNNLMAKKEPTISCGCAKSRGEEKIARILSENGIEFEREKSFKNCISENGVLLRFDFYLPKQNTCIEYDGEQHYFANGRGWNTQKHFEEIKKRDEIKNIFCQKERILLIRVPYFDFDKISLEYLGL